METPTVTIPPEVLNLNISYPNSEKGLCSSCVAFISGRRYLLEQIRTLPRYSSNFSISIVSACTSNRLVFLPYLVERWPGDFVIAIQAPKREEKKIQQEIMNLTLPSRVTIIMKVVQDTSRHFYINLLRNIAIKSIRTTHFIVLDMDMWPLPSAYDEFSRLPPSILNSNTSAVILPAVFIRGDVVLSNCTTLLDCALKSSEIWPKTKAELVRCINQRLCSTRKAKAVQHLYVAPSWHYAKKPYLEMKCFQNDLQEPYILLKYHEDMVLYDERFVDYGCNKVQLINTYRMMGYQFYILTQTFALDISHHDSQFRKAYMSYALAAKMNEMGKLCRRFLAKTNLVYAGQNKVDVCSDLYKYNVCYAYSRISRSFLSLMERSLVFENL